MNLINKYILEKCLFNTLLVSFAVLLIIMIVNIIGEINSLSSQYTFTAILIYSVLLLPKYIYMLMPLIILIGVLVGMSSLVNYSEYAIIRTAGISLKYIVLLLLCYGLIFSLLMFTFSEIIVPISSSYAQTYKNIKTHQMISSHLSSGIWSKDGQNTFINIKLILPNFNIRGVSILNYDKNWQLVHYITAESGAYNYTQNKWELSNVMKYTYTQRQIIQEYIAKHYIWHTTIVPNYFNLIVLHPDDMSLFSLKDYISHLKQSHQSITQYQIIFWNKIFYPFSCLSMILIVICFIPNNRRNVNLGTKIFFGIIVGLLFFLSTKLINFLTIVMLWNPIFFGVLPNIILVTVALAILYYQNKA
jgi:lipopolysaccharide export system permease protein